jgi:hypothetical protein
VRQSRRLSFGICAALLAVAVAAPAASAATPVGDYRFQNTLAPSLGLGPPLANLGPGTNGFASESVFGSLQPVLTFPQHNGVLMTPAGIPGGTAFSVVTTFRFANTTGYRRIIDWRNETSDEGLYVHDGKVSLYYGGPTDSPTALVSPNTWVTVAFVSHASVDGSAAYFNGTRVGISSIAPSVTGNTLRFFRDGAGGTPNEASAGAVACIRVFSGALTDAEVGQIGASQTCGGPPIPTAGNKCKKKKKKKGKGKSGAAAAKKKRKKCGKKKGKKRR